MPAGQGEIERQRVLAYGGSDSTRANFNRPRYTVHASKGSPRNLGTHSRADITVKGEIGAESGSQTLFFRFETTEEARVEARGIRINGYTDQYISLDLRDESGIALTYERLGEETADAVATAKRYIEAGYTICDYWQTGYVEKDCEVIAVTVAVAKRNVEVGYTTCGYWQNGYAQQDCAVATSDVHGVTKRYIGIGYADCRYWQNGYAEQDCEIVTSDEQGIEASYAICEYWQIGYAEQDCVFIMPPLPGIGTGYADCNYWVNSYAERDCSVALEVVDEPTAEEADPYFERIGAVVPPGSYDLVVSSSQWVGLPYEFQVLVTPLASSLAGEAGVEFRPKGSIALRALEGEASLSVLATGRLAVTYLLQGEALVEVVAQGLLERTSPFT